MFNHLQSASCYVQEVLFFCGLTTEVITSHNCTEARNLVGDRQPVREAHCKPTLSTN